VFVWPDNQKCNHQYDSHQLLICKDDFTQPAREQNVIFFFFAWSSISNKTVTLHPSPLAPALIRCYLVTRSAVVIGWFEGQGNGKRTGCVFLITFWAGWERRIATACDWSRVFQKRVAFTTGGAHWHIVNKWGASSPKNLGENLLKKTPLCPLGTRALRAMTSPKLTTLRWAATATRRLQSNTAGTNEKR